MIERCEHDCEADECFKCLPPPEEFARIDLSSVSELRGAVQRLDRISDAAIREAARREFDVEAPETIPMDKYEISVYAFERGARFVLKEDARQAIRDTLVQGLTDNRDHFYQEALKYQKREAELREILEAVRSEVCWASDRDRLTIGLKDLHPLITKALEAT